VKSQILGVFFTLHSSLFTLHFSLTRYTPLVTLSQDLALAQRAALAGARLGLDYFRRVQDLRVDFKLDGSFVTEADCRVEETVRSVLLDKRPADASLGEETGEHGSGRRRWILDGIDGTAEFLRGQSCWQTLIALEEDGVLTVASAAVPAQGRIWWAARGEGAYTGEIVNAEIHGVRRIHVRTGSAELATCRLGIVPDYHGLRDVYRAMVDDLVQRAQLTSWEVHPGLLVAAGDLDLAVQLAGKIWDYAAPSLIVQEAGGVFSGSKVEGHPVYGNAVYAANTVVHAAALDLLRA
jgi:histidinol-phosphatase